MYSLSTFYWIEFVLSIFISSTIAYHHRESGCNLTSHLQHIRARATYSFNPQSSRNIAVYYGRTDITTSTNLTNICSAPTIDIIILSFVTDILGQGGYPNMAFDKLCNLNVNSVLASSYMTTEMYDRGARGLVDCRVDLAPQIRECQRMGKKVLLGLGGQHGNATFEHEQEARDGAEMLWNLFGGGNGQSSSMRPFGNVTIDGFDMDNETGNTEFYEDFVTTLKSLFKSQGKKKYYLSASPSCSLLPATPQTPVSVLNLLDFVWPQFYGASSCNIGTSSFFPALSNWTERLEGPKLYIGAPAWVNGTINGGYESHSDFAQTVLKAKQQVGKEFGGVMLWDGAYGMANVDTTGANYVDIVKIGLKS